MDELKRMQEALGADEELQKKFEAEVKAASENGAKSDGEAVVMAANTLGFTISISDLEKEKAQELSDEELDDISGGDGAYGVLETEHGHDKFCAALWHCFVTMLHTETEAHDANCWKDYRCVFVNKDTVI